MLTAPRSLDAGLGLCPSAPHRALLGLLRVALDGPGEGPDSAALVADLRASSPETIVQLAFDASLHVVLASAFDRDPALRSAVPRDLIVFSQEMRAANLRRNQEIHAQLLEIGVAFAQAGLRGVALKGAAELLCPVYPDPGLRFLSDIDILLPADDVTRASQCLLDIGAVPDPEAQAELIGHHHEAPLGRPDWPVAVELHRAVGHGPAAARLLPPADLLGAAVATAETGLSVPAPAHRLAHAVLHAQYHGPCQRCRLLSPRDAMEFHVLSLGCAAREAEAARVRFAVGPDRIAWDALDAGAAGPWAILELALGRRGGVPPPQENTRVATWGRWVWP